MRNTRTCTSSVHGRSGISTKILFKLSIIAPDRVRILHDTPWKVGIITPSYQKLVASQSSCEELSGWVRISNWIPIWVPLTSLVSSRLPCDPSTLLLWATEHSHFRTNYLSYQYRLLKIHVIGIWGLWRHYRMRKNMKTPRRRWSSFWRPMDLSYMVYWRNMQKIKQGLSFYHICQGYSLTVDPAT